MQGGVLTFTVQTVEGFKRVRVTPGADNGGLGYASAARKMSSRRV